MTRFLLLLAVSAIAFAQAPQRPLRERLLERALKGDPEAQFDLGRNYEAGRIGLKRDYTQAHRWYLEAAEGGDPFAAASVGILLNFGKGVTRDYFQAYLWYERAIVALSGADRDSIAEMRDDIADKLTPEQIIDARRLAREWKPARK